MMKRSIVHRLIFQLHLWAGLSLGIYALLIGVTGSVLVFSEEIVGHVAPEPRLHSPAGQVSIQHMYERIQAQNAGWDVWSLEAPREPDAPWTSYLVRRGSVRSVFADPAGNIVGERRLEGTWFDLFARFHSNLLIRNGGRWYNGVAGLALAALSLTGFYLWWPSPGQWGNAFRIVRTSSLKGLIYDLHRVIGAATLVFTLLFCITGAYFTWPAVYRKIVAAVLPVNHKPAPPRVAVHGRQPLDALVAAARTALPDGVLVRIVGAQEERQPVLVVFRHGKVEENHKTSQVALEPATGKVLEVEAYSDRKAGDHIAGFLGPLHAGHFGGLAVKVVWASAGMALPLLFLTGVVVWCNRVVMPRLRRRVQAG
jgi:uncharacterized iron-regulated membrane protein